MSERKSALFRFTRKNKSKEISSTKKYTGVENNGRENKTDGNATGSLLRQNQRHRRSEIDKEVRGSSFNSLASLRSHISNSSANFNSSFLSDVNYEESFSENQIKGRDFTFLSSTKLSSYLPASSSTSFIQNQSADSANVSNSKKELTFDFKLHPTGYPLAMPKLCKLISSSKNSIIQAGGCPLKKEGFVMLSVPHKSKTARSRLLTLENGKIKIYKVDEKAGNLKAVPGVKKKELTLVLQRIFDIKYLSFESKQFSLIFEKRRKKKKGMMNIIRSKSMTSQKRTSFRRMNGKQTMKEQETTPRPQAPPESPSRKVRNRNTGSSTFQRVRNGTDTSQKTRTLKRTGTLRFKLTRSKTSTSTGSLLKSPPRSGRSRRSFEQSQPLPSRESLKPKKKDNLLVPEDKERETDLEEVIISFDSKEECHKWLAAILLEVENQAKLFSNCITLLEDKEEEDNYEIILRKAVDLLTLAKGVRNRNVWEMRERLAKSLEKRKKMKEAKFWYNLSAQNREDICILDLIENAKLKKKSAADTRPRNRESVDHVTASGNGRNRTSRANSRNGRRTVYSFGSLLSIRFDDKESRRIMPPPTKALAIESLTLFIEQHSRSDSLVLKANDEAIRMVKDKSYVEIAKRCEAEYGRVPDGFEFYLIVAGKSPLEKVREMSEALKLQDRSRRRQ